MGRGTSEELLAPAEGPAGDRGEAHPSPRCRTSHVSPGWTSAQGPCPALAAVLICKAEALDGVQH